MLYLPSDQKSECVDEQTEQIKMRGEVGCVLDNLDRSLHTAQNQNDIDDRSDVEEFLAELNRMDSQHKARLDRRSDQVQGLKKAKMTPEAWRLLGTFDLPTPPGEPGPNHSMFLGEVHQAEYAIGGRATFIDVRPRETSPSGLSVGDGVPTQEAEDPASSSPRSGEPVLENHEDDAAPRYS